MDQYHLSDECPLNPELQLNEFSENQALDCSDTFSPDLCPDMREIVYSGLNNLDVDPSLSATNVNNESSEDNLDSLSLYAAKECSSTKLLDSSDPHSQPFLHELGLPALPPPKEVEQGGRSSSGGGKKGKNQQACPQAPVLDCSLCGKVFSSSSSLSKHYVTHSQERKHVCKICSKAFKRQDHLSGHMLTHQKTKPFICIEQGCNKSYSDHRSLRRHYEMHHGMRLLKDDEAGESSSIPRESRVQMGHGSRRTTTERLVAHPDPQVPSSNLPPNKDLLRCIVSTLVGQKHPSAPSPRVGQNDVDARGNLPPCTSIYSQISCVPTSTVVLSEIEENKSMKETCPGQKNVSTSSLYTIINPGKVSTLGQAESTGSLPERQAQSQPQFALENKTLEYWPKSTIAHLPLFQGQKLSAASQPSDGNFQWVRNVPAACSQSKGSGLCATQASSASSQEVPQEAAGSSAFNSLARHFEQPDVLSFTPSLLKAQEEISGESKASGLGVRFPEDAKHGVLQKCEAEPLFQQLFVKSQDSSVNQDSVQVRSRLFQRITKSQHIVSHSQLLAPSHQPAVDANQLHMKPLPSMFPRQADLALPFPEPTESEGCLKKSSVQVRTDLSSRHEQEGQQPPLQLLSMPAVSKDGVFPAKHTRTLKTGCLGFKDVSFPSQSSSVYEITPGNHTYGKLKQSDGSSPGARNKEKNKKSCKESSCKAQSRSSRPRRKEKPKIDIFSVASPSQVAMASFSLPSTSFDNDGRVKPKLSIFNRIQGGNIYSFGSSMREEHFPPASSKPGDRNDLGSGFACTTCSHLFYTEKGLRSHMCFCSQQWQPTAGKEKLQACVREDLQPQKSSVKAAGDGVTPEARGASKSAPENAATTPFVIPVSVPVMAASQLQAKRVKKESQDDNDLQEGMPPKKKRRHTCPKPLFIPPPTPACNNTPPSTGRCFQSNLRSPVFLMDHLLQGLIQHSPYTPPPMLSPLREGSGLYFNSLCPTTSSTTSNNMYTSVLDSTNGAFVLSLVKDATKIRVKPHINIGSRFQAEIPDLQERSSMEHNKDPATLMWKPWGDIATNKETQDRVTDLLKLACSSAMPGGGTNLELGIHCLHEAQGDIMKTLDMLLLRGPQKPPGHPLASYRYSGSSLWTPTEKQLFKKAFGLHKKDFYLLQKMIQTKTVAQCVEYYYSWKKILKFNCGRVQAVERRAKRKRDEIDMDDEKIGCSPKKRHCHLPKQENNIKPRNYKKATQTTFSPASGSSQKDTLDRPRNPGSQGAFPCKECARVFDKIKSRNAHMKRHRLQDQVEPMIKIKWPVKHSKSEPKKEERSPDAGFLQR